MSVPTIPDSAALAPEVLQALRNLRLIVRASRRPAGPSCSAAGLGASQLGCLAAVQAAPGLRVTQLAQALDVRQATASNLVDVLERRGLLERRRDTKDQRVVHLHLTAEGRRLAPALPQPATGALPHALGRLEPAALARLNTVLHELVGLMGGETLPAAELWPTTAPTRSKKNPRKRGS